MTTSTSKTQWFTEARFGLFIHWGLYALPARHEWIRDFESITDENYQKYFDLFDPDLFDAREWAKAAKAAGMKYVVFTAKHHEGFCLWDSQYTDYKAPRTPAGRDLLREVVDAFRAEGLRIGLYYSLLDWHHPDFVIDNRHGPYRGHPDRAQMNEGRDMRRYAQYMRDQITELLTGYGQIDIVWFDFSYPANEKNPEGKGRNDWESEKLLALVRSLQPNAIVSNRLDLPECSDVATPEQFTPSTGIKDAGGNPVVWEGCHTLSGSWGYHRDETSWKTPRMCIELLVNHVSRGGNLLMNVGPTARGNFDVRAVDCLGSYAMWMKFNARAIYGCEASPFQEAENCRYTYNPKTNRLYIHVMVWPFRDLHLPDLAGKIRYVQFLQDGSELNFSEQAKSCGTVITPKGFVTIQLPLLQPNSLLPVIEVILK